MLWALADNLGSVRDVVDNDGDVQNHIVYDSFGNITSESDDTVRFFIGFAGRERDYESDLYHNWRRYYEALTALWISQDPIGFAAGDTNLSRYVGNSPTNFTDPSGLKQREQVYLGERAWIEVYTYHFLKNEEVFGIIHFDPRNKDETALARAIAAQLDEKGEPFGSITIPKGATASSLGVILNNIGIKIILENLIKKPNVKYGTPPSVNSFVDPNAPVREPGCIRGFRIPVNTEIGRPAHVKAADTFRVIITGVYSNAGVPAKGTFIGPSKGRFLNEPHKGNIFRSERSGQGAAKAAQKAAAAMQEWLNGLNKAFINVDMYNKPIYIRIQVPDENGKPGETLPLKSDIFTAGGHRFGADVILRHWLGMKSIPRE